MNLRWLRDHARQGGFLAGSGLFLALALWLYGGPVDFSHRQKDLAAITTGLEVAVEKLRTAQTGDARGPIRLFAANPKEVEKLQNRLIQDGGAPKGFHLDPDYAYDIALPPSGGVYLRVLPTPAAVDSCGGPGWLLAVLIPDFCGVVPGIWQSYKTTSGKGGSSWLMSPAPGMGKAK
jgi:hypothetical protein